MFRFIASITFLIVATNSYGQVNRPIENDNPSGTPATFTLPNFLGVNLSANAFNYNRTFKPRYATSSIPIGWGKISVNTTYFNGWENPIQSIKTGSLTVDDIITPNDQRAKLTAYTFLPYINGRNTSFHNDPFNDQRTFYNSSAYPEYSMELGNSFDIDKIEIDPQTNFVYHKKYSPGASFAGSNRGTSTHTIYNNNTAGNIWIFSLNGLGAPEITGAYSTGQIRIEIKNGEHNAETQEYYNKSGQLICKKVKIDNGWLETYYVYDDFSKLVWLLTPKVTATISGVGWTPSASALDGLCYHNVYNAFGEVIESKVPDQLGVSRFVYDRKHRMVLEQSPLLAQQGKWLFNVYDDMDRVAFSGLVQSSNSQSAWQSIVSTTPPNGTIDYYLAKGFDNRYQYPPTTLPGCEINVVNYYDNYNNMPSPMAGRNYSTSYATDFLTGQTIRPHQVHKFKSFGLQVGSQVRVLDPLNNNLWISKVFFYDEFGRLLQTHSKNHWATTTTWDVEFNQYNFTGDLVFNIKEHNAWSGTTKPQTIVMTKYNYNEYTGQLIDVKQNVDNNGWLTLSSYSYDKRGKLIKKAIGDVEEQEYKYNIRGQIISINKKYVEDPTYNNKMTYGENIYYDHGFQQKRYDGTIAGYIWRGTGSLSMPRSYGYGYDMAGRMTFADFNERVLQYNASIPPWIIPPYWSSDKHSTWGLNYDHNGNIMAMQQKDLNSSASEVVVDQLQYQYQINSNRLARVIDNAANHGTNDFFDGNVSGSDYVYDQNGNLSSDLNKGIQSITYNYLDLPTQINSGSNSVKNIYDGLGNIVQKTTNVGGIDTTYKYWGPFQYRDNIMQFFSHDEGRTRWMKDSLKFKNDFFIKDHLGNVRSVLTTDISYATMDYWAGFEMAGAPSEEALFTQIAPIRESKPVGTPGDVMSGELDGLDPAKRMGTAIIFKARPGDQIDLHSWAYYEAADSINFNTYAPSEDMFQSLLTTFSGPGLVGGGEGGTPSISQPVMSAILNPSNYNVYENLKNNITDPAYPRLYLNFLVFDQQMNLLPDQSSITQLKGGSNVWNRLDKDATYTVEATGYVMAYISLESAMKLHIDNTNITVVSGRQLEEQHYYPHGRLIDPQTAILPDLENKYLYQSKKLQTELNLDLYDFHARQYDPQLGRFWGVDPANQFPSGYTGMANDPANDVDPTGMISSNGSGEGGDLEVDGFGFIVASMSVAEYRAWAANNYYNGDVLVMGDAGGGGGGGGGGRPMFNIANINFMLNNVVIAATRPNFFSRIAKKIKEIWKNVEITQDVEVTLGVQAGYEIDAPLIQHGVEVNALSMDVASLKNTLKESGDNYLKPIPGGALNTEINWAGKDGLINLKSASGVTVKEVFTLGVENKFSVAAEGGGPAMNGEFKAEGGFNIGHGKGAGSGVATTGTYQKAWGVQTKPAPKTMPAGKISIGGGVKLGIGIEYKINIVFKK